MDGLEKIVAHIRSKSEMECKAITKAGAEECETIRVEYKKKEQDEYWKAINIGSKDAEQRLESLSSLAAMEAKKQVTAMQQEILEAAFALAAKNMLELPEDKLTELRIKHDAPAGCSTTDFVELFKEKLSQGVLSTLFD